MFCVLSTAHSARRLSASLFAGLVILVIIVLPLRANELNASPAQNWCVARSGEQLDCAYDDLFTCSVKALATGGYCTKAEPPAQAVVTVEPAPPPKPRKPPRRKPATTHNDELFREFVRWKEAGGR